MKKVIIYLLSALLCFSFCLKISADDNELILHAYQNTDGDLIIEASGPKKDEFLNGIKNNSCLSFENENQWYGDISNFPLYSDSSDYVANYIIEDDKVIMKKETLINIGFVDGDYLVYTRNPVYASFNIHLELGKTITTIDSPSYLFIGSTSITTPKVGESTDFDHNINVVCRFSRIDQTYNIPNIEIENNETYYKHLDGSYYKCYWAEEILSDSPEYISTNRQFEPTNDKTFMEGKKYYFVVDVVCLRTKTVNDDENCKIADVGFGDYKNDTKLVYTGYLDEYPERIGAYFYKTIRKQFVFEISDIEPKTPAFKISETKNYGNPLNVKIADSIDKVSASILDEKDYYMSYSFNIYLLCYGKSFDCFNDWTKEDVALIKDNLKGYIFGEEFYFELYEERSNSSVSTRATGESMIEETNSPISINVELPDNLINVNNNINREYKIARVHNGEFDLLDATLNLDNTLTFKTNKFSTFAIVYKDLKKDDNKSSATIKSNYKVVTCEETNGIGWTWSENKKTCVYKVTNTSSK